jgi:hypothetical protein
MRRRTRQTYAAARGRVHSVQKWSVRVLVRLESLASGEVAAVLRHRWVSLRGRVSNGDLTRDTLPASISQSTLVRFNGSNAIRRQGPTPAAGRQSTASRESGVVLHGCPCTVCMPLQHARLRVPYTIAVCQLLRCSKFTLAHQCVHAIAGLAGKTDSELATRCAACELMKLANSPGTCQPKSPDHLGVGALICCVLAIQCTLETSVQSLALCVWYHSLIAASTNVVFMFLHALACNRPDIVLWPSMTDTVDTVQTGSLNCSSENCRPTKHLMAGGLCQVVSGAVDSSMTTYGQTAEVTMASSAP